MCWGTGMRSGKWAQELGFRVLSLGFWVLWEQYSLGLGMFPGQVDAYLAAALRAGRPVA